MKKRVIYLIGFFILMILHFILCSNCDITFNLWLKTQLINIAVLIPMMIMLFFGLKKMPDNVGFLFMIGLTLAIVGVKFIGDKNVDGLEMDKMQKFVLMSSFLIYLAVIVLILVEILKNVKFNSKKE